MKIIISRKGFDSKYGGTPSPIFPNGEMVSFPIPSEDSHLQCGSVSSSMGNLGGLFSQLTSSRLNGSTRIHLDPDLDSSALARQPGWLPAFGQVGGSQSHLVNQGVGVGDLFLFFGWFRNVYQNSAGNWDYHSGAPDLHVLFGWLQIDDIIPVGNNFGPVLGRYPWLNNHPHLSGNCGPTNTVYIATKNLKIPGLHSFPGGGVFDFDQKRVLTASGFSRSVWRLPSWFFPSSGIPTLSYHKNPKRWTPAGGDVLLNSAKIGQEFVLDCNNSQNAIPWASSLF